MNDTPVNLPANISVPLRLDDGCIVTIRGDEFELRRSYEGVHEFREMRKPHRIQTVTETDLRQMLEDGEAEVEAGRLSRGGAALRKTCRHVSLRDLPHAEWERVMLLHYLCTEFDRMKMLYQKGKLDRKVNLGKRCLDWLLPEAQERIVKAHNKRSQRYTQKKLFEGRLPSARQFSREYAKHVAFGGSPAAFLREYRGPSTRAKRGDPLERRIRDRFQKGLRLPETTEHGRPVPEICADA